MSVARRSKLIEINVEIKRRSAYYRQQEVMINDLVERGNTQLMSLTYEITLAKNERAELKAEIRALKQDKRLLEEDLDRTRAELAGELDYQPFASA